MSEESGNPKPFSGIRPGGGRPTVIGEKKPPTAPTAIAPREHQPTVIGGNSSQTHPGAPTVIKGGQPATATKEHQPTMITPISRPLAPPPPVTPVALCKPSAIPGTVCKGVEIPIEELTRYFPGTPVATLRRAGKIIKGIVLDLLTDAHCAMWGAETQKRFGELTERSLKLTGSNVAQDNERHLARLYALLDELGTAFRKNGSKGFLFLKTHESPWEKFQGMSAELHQLRQLLNQSLPSIIDTEAKLTSLSAEFETLAFDLDAESLAGRYIAEKLLMNKHRASQALLDRSNSLNETVAHIQQGILLRDQATGTIRELVSRIQDGVLSALPAWIDSITLTFQRPSQTETDIYTLRHGLEELLQQLK